jgi:hypothetical protein
VEALVLHLRDTFVIVHDSAIRAISWNTRWLEPTQFEDVIQQLAGWAKYYRNKNPYKLRDICRPILSLSQSVAALRYAAVRFITNLLPTEEPCIDRDLVEMLTDNVEPAEDVALCVAQQIAAWLAHRQRDPNPDHGDDAREQTYAWLRSLPLETFHELRGSLNAVGREVAESGDAWSAFRFSALFASFGDFRNEAEILGITKGNLPEGRRNERLIETLGDLEQAAKGNEQLAR